MGSAVLIPTIRTDEGTMILFEVRTDNVSQPGEICFPGGRVEAGEAAEQAAVRETFEELGIGQEHIRIIREYETDITLAGKTIQPILAEIDPAALDGLVLSGREVKEIFLAPLEWFRKTPAREYNLEKDVPPEALGKYLKNYPDLNYVTLYWEYNGYGIWGLTARILRRFIEE